MTKCDVCGKTATVDTKTIYGPWAYLCTTCNTRIGCGIAGLTNKLQNGPTVLTTEATSAICDMSANGDTHHMRPANGIMRCEYCSRDSKEIEQARGYFERHDLPKDKS